MSIQNNCSFIGNLGAAPNVRAFENGNKVANFSIAVNSSYKNKDGERIEQTEWANIVVWNGLAGVAEKYLNKGSKISVSGRLSNRTYEDNEGNKKYITEFLCNELLMLDSKPKDPETKSDDVPTSTTAQEPTVDDLPF